MEDDRVRIRRLHAFDAGKVGAGRRAGGLVEDALEGKLDVLRGHRIAAVERDVLAELLGKSVSEDELWKQVVLAYGVAELGLKTRCMETLDDGKPIPRDWDPSSTAPY